MGLPFSREEVQDLRDAQFDQNVRVFAGPNSGLTIALLRRIGREYGLQREIDDLVAEFANLFTRNGGRITDAGRTELQNLE